MTVFSITQEGLDVFSITQQGMIDPSTSMGE